MSSDDVSKDELSARYYREWHPRSAWAVRDRKPNRRDVTDEVHALQEQVGRYEEERQALLTERDELRDVIVSVHALFEAGVSRWSHQALAEVARRHPRRLEAEVARLADTPVLVDEEPSYSDYVPGGPTGE